MAWGKRILIGAAAAYLALSFGHAGQKSKSFGYLLDHLGNRNGRAEEQELEYFLKHLPPFPATIAPVTSYLAYDDASPENRVFFSYHTQKGLEEYLTRSGKTQNMRVVTITYTRDIFLFEDHAYRAVEDITYHTFEDGKLREETSSEKIRRNLTTLLN